jgi:hypothetical protein
MRDEDSLPHPFFATNLVLTWWMARGAAGD